MRVCVFYERMKKKKPHGQSVGLSAHNITAGADERSPATPLKPPTYCRRVCRASCKEVLRKKIGLPMRGTNHRFSVFFVKFFIDLIDDVSLWQVGEGNHG